MPRTVEEIRAELAASRAKLTEHVAGLVEDNKPQNIAKRSLEDAKSFVDTEFQAAKAQVKTDDGLWRTDRLMAIGGAVLGAVVFGVTVRAIAKSRQKKSLYDEVRAAVEAQRS